MARRKRNKKWISWLIILVLLVVAAVVAYLVWDSYFKEKGDSAEPEQESVIQEDKRLEEDTMDSDEMEDDKKVKQYEGEDPNEAEELSGVVTYAGVGGGTVMIRANIDQYLGGGSCKLSLLDGATVAYEEVVGIASAASTATCEGFDIPVSQLGDGDYEIVIDVEADGKTGTIRGEINI